MYGEASSVWLWVINVVSLCLSEIFHDLNLLTATGTRSLTDVEHIFHRTRSPVLEVLKTLLHAAKTAWDDLLLLAPEEAFLETTREVSAVDEPKVFQWAMHRTDISGTWGLSAFVMNIHVEYHHLLCCVSPSSGNLPVHPPGGGSTNVPLPVFESSTLAMFLTLPFSDTASYAYSSF